MRGGGEDTAGRGVGYRRGGGSNWLFEVRGSGFGLATLLISSGEVARLCVAASPIAV